MGSLRAQHVAIGQRGGFVRSLPVEYVVGFAGLGDGVTDNLAGRIQLEKCRRLRGRLTGGGA